MFKATPNPPETDTGSDASLETEKLKEADDRAFAHYFPPPMKNRPNAANTTYSPSPPISTPKPCWPMPPKICCPSAPLQPIWRTMWKDHAGR